MKTTWNRMASTALALGFGGYAAEAQAEVIYVDHTAAPLEIRDAIETTTGAATTLDLDLDGDGDIDMRFGHVHQYAPRAGNVRTWATINPYWPGGFDRATWVGAEHPVYADRYMPVRLGEGEMITSTDASTGGWSGGDPVGWIAARNLPNIVGDWYSTDGSNRRGYVGFQTADGHLGWIDLEARHDNLNPADSANNYLIIHGWAYETDVGVPVAAGLVGPADADADGVADEDDLCPGADDVVFAPALDDNMGFSVDIDIDDEDVVLHWDPLPTGSGNVEIWRATDPADLPSNAGPCDRGPGATAQPVFSGVELEYVDVGAADQDDPTPTYFYRVMSDGVDVDSVVLAKVTHEAHEGYNLFGMCMVDGLEFASEFDDHFGDSAVLIQTWDASIPGWRTWWTHDGAGSQDFALPYGGTLLVQFDDSVRPYQSMAGRVPTGEAPLAALPGHNVLSWPLVTGGYEPLASEYFPQSAYTAIESWDPAAQQTRWYYGGAGDPDFQLTACGAYGFDL